MLTLYRPTPFQVKPATSSSTVHLHVPPKRQSSSPRRSDPSQLARDERLFSKEYLATQSSIYFRRSNASLRSFHWRVVGDSKVLEVQCADLTRSENDIKEAYLTLKFEFEAAIIPNGVAFSDPEKKDILNIFVVTANKALHTLDLPISFFRDEKAPQTDTRSWNSTFTPTSFTIDQPHLIYASNPYELFLSLESGRLQRLTRTGNEREWKWEQINYDDRSWGASIRGMVSRRAPKPVQHGSRSLNGMAAHAIVAASDSTFCVHSLPETTR